MNRETDLQLPPVWTVGVVVGKFNPPHLGHLHLIQQASARVERLYIILCDRQDQTLSSEQRRAWLLDAAPANVQVLVTPDDLPPANEPWARRALDVLPEAPDVGFTSEDWGPGWAECMGAEHVLVDLHRTAFPISASALRSDLGGGFTWLVAAARQALARRVVLVGAESTGKTAMADALARRLGTVWVPEHGRWYWEGRRYVADQSWTTDELRRIAASQVRLEEDLARRATQGIVVVDTDALVTAVWHERYLGSRDPILERMASERVPELYLICSPDFPWVQDGTRESEEHRSSMHESTIARIRASGARIGYLTGSHEDRLSAAMDYVMPLTRFDPLV